MLLKDCLLHSNWLLQQWPHYLRLHSNNNYGYYPAKKMVILRYKKEIVRLVSWLLFKQLAASPGKYLFYNLVYVAETSPGKKLNGRLEPNKPNGIVPLFLTLLIDYPQSLFILCTAIKLIQHLLKNGIWILQGTKQSHR